MLMADTQGEANMHHISTAALPTSRTANDQGPANYTNQSNGSPSTSLDGLPPEMFERVAELTTAEDLKALRLVSHSIGAKALRTCKIVLFSTVRVMLCSEASIREALEHVQHPIVGQSLRQMVLYDNVLVAPNEAKDLNIPNTRRVIHRLIEAYDAQEHLKERMDLLPLLIELFEKIMSGGRMLSSFRVEKCVSSRLESRQPFLPLKCYARWVDGSFLRTILDAMVTSQLSGHTCTMSAREIGPLGGSYSTMIPIAYQTMMAQYRSVFSRFKDLELAFLVEETDQTQFADSTAIKAFCEESFCEKIVSLNLVGQAPWRWEVNEPSAHQFDEVMSAKFPRLKSLLLLSFDIDCAALLAFVKSHKTLASVEFIYGRLRNAAGTLTCSDYEAVRETFANTPGFPELVAFGAYYE